jgi:signal transduction histidine kinase
MKVQFNPFNTAPAITRRLVDQVRRSLTIKWLVSLLFTGLFGIALVGLIANRATSSGFDQLKLEQLQASFESAAQQYYKKAGSWAGFVESLAQTQIQVILGTPGEIPPQFLLVDAANTVIVPMPPYRVGEQLQPAQVSGGTPIVVDGATVGAVLINQANPILNPMEQRFLGRINEGLLIGAVGSSILALLIGIALTRLFTRPLRDLTGAIHAMHQGQLDQEVPVRSQDELGDLTRAFNQMSKEISRANYLRRQMTADIAHDLRTPLTVINGYLEALGDGTLKPTHERFAAMHQEVAQLQRLIEDLRTVSLADSGELKLAYQETAIEPLLNQVATAFQPLCEANGLQLAVSSDPTLPPQRIDRERIVQVLGNLVSNAIRHTSRGGRITLRGYHGPGGVCVSVQDTGEGIPAEKLPFIFERLYRVDEARTANSGESGLGLAIVKSIMEAHGGTATAESQIGVGTTLTIQFRTDGAAAG